MAFKILTKSRPRDMPLGNRGLGDDHDQTDTTDACWSGTTALAAAGMLPLRAFAASRTYHALLVACTDYPNLPQKNWLIGPKNDAVLVRDYLLSNVPAPVKFAPENITMLADGVDGANGFADPCGDHGGARRRSPARCSATTSSTCICPAMARSSRRPRPATRPTGSTRSSCRPTSANGSIATRACPTR